MIKVQGLQCMYMRSAHKLILCCVVIVFARAGTVVAEDFPNTLGWEWQIAPHQPAEFIASRGHLVLSESGPGDQFNVTLARSTAGGDAHGTQIVAFDEERRPFRLKPRQGGGQNGISMQRWILPPEDLEASRVAFVGIEILTRRSVERATKKASAAAKKAGIEVLPFPIAGEPYEFQLTDSEGKKLKTADFSGEVLVMDCWATWCTPCVAKLPALKELHDRLNDRGLNVVGINFDQSPRVHEEVAEKLGLDWRTVYVPSDDETRDTWHAVNGILALPRVLVVDKKGNLRANLETLDEKQLESLIERLLDAPE